MKRWRTRARFEVTRVDRIASRLCVDLRHSTVRSHGVCTSVPASRELHDALGGLLVAARMDLSWLEERVNSDDPEVRAYFGRIQQALEHGFDIKRRVIENLRPTLLDNLGLFSALRWQVAEYHRKSRS